jgi:Fic family protein
VAKISEVIYNSNAIENSSLTLEDTEKILLKNSIPKGANLREVYEAKNLANITELQKFYLKNQIKHYHETIF